MSCNNNLKNQHYKSAQNAYNDATQAFTAVGTPVAVLGVLSTDTGCSVDTVTGGFQINASGLYRISYDVTFTTASAGVAVLQGLHECAGYRGNRDRVYDARRDHGLYPGVLQWAAHDQRYSGRRGRYDLPCLCKRRKTGIRGSGHEKQAEGVQGQAGT